MIGIYKITNPEGKVYIGQSICIDSRFDTHRKAIYSQGKLKESFEVFGADNHVFEIIEECEECDLNKREMYWINELESVKNGLNTVQPTGDSVGKNVITVTGFTAEQVKEIKKQAKEKCLPMSSYCRQLILKVNN